MNMDNIEVTILCITYNHAGYIKDALESFVNQKTSFKYQIIVHDDASTDGTREIIKEYLNKYPELIVPILQDENIYSRGIRSDQYINPLLKGKYIAVCEGDDYWCDDFKLQKQYDIMQADESLSTCVHNTRLIDNVSGNNKVMYSTECNGKLDTIKVIMGGGGGLFHTSSLFFRKEFYTIPDAFRIPYVGDYPRAVFLALNGGIYYISDIMSVYRYNTIGSFTSKITQERHKLIQKGTCDFLRNVDEYSNNKYHAEITDRIGFITFDMLLNENDFVTIEEELGWYLKRHKKMKLEYILKKRFPYIYMLKNKVFSK